MRCFALIFIVLCLVAAICASPAGNKKKAPACGAACNDDYKPICAKEQKSNKLVTFGNDCVMRRVNCEHPQTVYAKEKDGECGGNVSVRLS